MYLPILGTCSNSLRQMGTSVQRVSYKEAVQLGVGCSPLTPGSESQIEAVVSLGPPRLHS